MIDFALRPARWSRHEWLLAAGATLAVSLSRIWGLARSPWDWDEILFSFALQRFDVAMHQPHPPGFPLYVGAAKAFQSLGLTDFHSLQAVNLVAGILLVPAMLLFCRELRFPFASSLIAALAFAFAPNVWFFNETGFSDVPSAVLAVAACGFLLQGCRSNRAFIGGAALLAVAAGFRPQNLVVGLIPIVIAVCYRWRARQFLAIATAAFIGVLIVIASYWTAAELTGVDAYRSALRAHEKYIAATDSFRSPLRPPLYRVFDDFFIRPYDAPLLNLGISALVLVSLAAALLRRKWPVLVATLTFLPFCVIAWLVLDRFSASRFSIGYAPLFAILTADGISVIASAASSRRRRLAIEIGVSAVLVVLLAGWTVPALRITRGEVSPPVRAMEWITAHADRRTTNLLVGRTMVPFADYYAPFHEKEKVAATSPIAHFGAPGAIFVREADTPVAGAANFTWPLGRLSQITRRRYFVVAVSGVPQPGFADGWYSEERVGASTWRWMPAHAVIFVPGVQGRSRLSVRFVVPLHALSGRPTVTIRVNGAVADRLTIAEPITEWSRDVKARSGLNRITFEIDRTVNPRAEGKGPDERNLGLRLDRLDWRSLL